jgi:hypothetical protein
MAATHSAHSNPTWERDELILALDLCFEHNPNTISARRFAVSELSDVCNRLPIHGDVSGFAKFRNPNGVYMKLCNFLRLDPAFPSPACPGPLIAPITLPELRSHNARTSPQRRRRK